MNRNREDIYTGPEPLETRLKLWKEMQAACQEHIDLAKEFQAAGEHLIKQLQAIQSADDIDPEKLVSYYHRSLSYLEKGVAMEKASRQELFSLAHKKPK